MTEVKIRLVESGMTEPYEVAIDLSSSVMQLKEKLENIHSRPARGFIVCLGGDVLADNKSLEDSHILAGTLLTVEFRQVSARITATNRRGGIVKLNAEMDWSVRTLKAEASVKLECLPSEVRVLDMGDEVTDESRLVRDLEGIQLAVIQPLHGGDALDSSSR